MTGWWFQPTLPPLKNDGRIVNGVGMTSQYMKWKIETTNQVGYIHDISIIYPLVN